ncbi:MAG: sugar ABC transporter permease [Chloroflexi bacterium RBG_13_50_10]|nr:MAG: sugar ABC transporter permease [Chloroflexi bacterium RBG_13_50_10]
MVQESSGTTHIFLRFLTSLRRLISRLPLHIILIGAALLWMTPTFGLLVSSFRPATAVGSTGWWTAFQTPFQFTLDNYSSVLSQNGMARSFLNSLIITIPATIIPILVAGFAAFAFAWMKFPGRNALFIFVVALLVVPIQVTLIPVLRLFTDVKLVGTFPGIWLAHTAYGLPLAIFLLRNFFGALPRELLESAYLDGASNMRVFFRLILPLSVPALASLAIFQFLWVWNDLLVALVYLQSPSKAPMTLTINNLVSSFGTQWQLLTAAAFISMILPLIIFFALQRYFVEGITAGAVKG